MFGLSSLVRGRLETGIDARSRRLSLQLLELLKPFVRHVVISSTLLLLLVGLGLLLLQPRAVLQHLLDLLLLTWLLLLSKRLSRGTKLRWCSTVATKVQAVHNTWDLFFLNLPKGIDPAAYGTCPSRLWSANGAVKEA